MTDNRTLHEQAVEAAHKHAVWPYANRQRASLEAAERMAGAVLGVVRQAIREQRPEIRRAVEQAVRDTYLFEEDVEAGIDAGLEVVLALFPEEQQRDPQERSKEGKP